MKNFKKVILNMAVCVNVMIFGILTLVAFYSIGFNRTYILSNVKDVENGTKYFALALSGIILVWCSMILPVLKLFFRKDFQTKIITITILVVLTAATTMMMASIITFAINIEEGTSFWNIFGVMLLLLVGYSITIQPQIKIIFFKNETKKSNDLIEEA
ncbi:hypothetical protein [Mesoplasma coleopterae]|uniref:Uncharacterized protein n=1 Tax=Mesoplasma coleopterae TaxID=324078 RepID=A0A2K8P2S7_9MOLU|nr:hypothetical protein [Mesoplasma coleopterae]ATZ21052.1 hypothetical protein MCOLE_v1c05410 [Mesoplasma coleopterae]AVN62533.1 hypothetical protein CG001_02745 [Mesoplasma coleopterae]